MSVLHIGCGGGDLMLDFARTGFSSQTKRIVGIDQFDECINEAN